MITLSLAFVTAASLASGTVAAVVAGPGDKDGERIKRLVAKPKSKVAALPDLPTASNVKLIARTGIGQDSLKSIRRYQAEADGGAFKVVLLDVAWRGGAVRLGAATAPEGHVHRVAVFDDFGKEIKEFDEFLAQFTAQDGARLTEASNDDIGAVIQKRDAIVNAAKPPVKPQEKKTWALFKHHLLMQTFDDRWRALDAARDKGGPLVAAVKKLDEQAAAIEQFSDQMRAVMQPKTLGTYRELLKGLRVDAAKAIELEEKGDAEGAAKVVKGALKMDCGKCHASEANEWKLPLEGALRDQLKAAGFKPGAFVVDVDVKPMAYSQEEAQLLATSVKACLLAARE